METSTAVPRLLVPVHATRFNLHHASLGAQPGTLHGVRAPRTVPGPETAKHTIKYGPPPLELVRTARTGVNPANMSVRVEAKVHVDTANRLEWLGGPRKHQNIAAGDMARPFRLFLPPPGIACPCSVT